MASNTTRPMLQRKQFTTAPAIFDLVSAKIADRTAAPAIYMTGWRRSASHRLGDAP